MRSLLLPLLLAAPLPALAQDTPPPPAEGEGEAGDPKADRRAEREARKAEQAAHGALLEAVRAVLHANAARVLDDGRLELRYTFKEAAELDDWDLRGFDRAEEGRKRGRRARGERGQNLALGVSSNQQGLLRHTLKLAGDFEVVFKLRVIRSASDSDLVVGVGKAGARFGTQLVEQRASGFRPVNRKSEADKAPFNGGKAVTVTLTRVGGIVRVRAGEGAGEVSDDLNKEAEGEVFLFAADMHLALDEVVIRCVADRDEINRLGFE